MVRQFQTDSVVIRDPHEGRRYPDLLDLYIVRFKRLSVLLEMK